MRGFGSRGFSARAYADDVATDALLEMARIELREAERYLRIYDLSGPTGRAVNDYLRSL